MTITCDSSATVKISKICLSSLKDKGRERTDSSGGREKVGEGSATRRGQKETGGERDSDFGTTEP